MTATLPRNPTTGRFTTRPPLPTCESCGRVLFENLAADLLCLFERCGLYRQVVGNTGADVGSLRPDPHTQEGKPMSATGYTSAADAAHKIMPWPATHYGCRVVELGESSDDWAVSGHVPERRAKAAVMHYLRVDVGISGRDPYDSGYFEDVVNAAVDHTWAAPTGDEDEPWEWCDAFREGAEPVTLVSLR